MEIQGYIKRVGKTSLLERYIHNIFTMKTKVTIGADFFSKDLSIDNEKANIQIWDTAGQEKYRSLGKAYYRGSDLCVIVFDLLKTL